MAKKYASKYYDPVKRREYYLRTRKLKGRKKGAGKKKQTKAKKAKAAPLTAAQATQVGIVKEYLKLQKKVEADAIKAQMKDAIKSIESRIGNINNLPEGEREAARQQLMREVAVVKQANNEASKLLDDKYKNILAQETQKVKSGQATIVDAPASGDENVENS